MAQGLPNLCVPCSSPDGVTTVWYIGLSVCSRYRILSQSELLLSCLQPAILYHGSTAFSPVSL